MRIRELIIKFKSRHTEKVADDEEGKAETRSRLPRAVCLAESESLRRFLLDRQSFDGAMCLMCVCRPGSLRSIANTVYRFGWRWLAYYVILSAAELFHQINSQFEVNWGKYLHLNIDIPIVWWLSRSECVVDDRIVDVTQKNIASAERSSSSGYAMYWRAFDRRRRRSEKDRLIKSTS